MAVFPEWEEAYGVERCEIVFENEGAGKTARYVVDIEEGGDEAFLEPFFAFLKGIVKRRFPGDPRDPARVGVQMLDSAHADFWRPR